VARPDRRIPEQTLTRRQPDHPPPPPTVQRVRIRYAKRGRLRFASHRDFARAFERALRRAGVPMAFSAGFSPHPKISYLGAAPTGVASEAEYLEVGLATRVDPDWLRDVLDGVLPPGLDVLECVQAGPGSLADRIDASHWRIELPGVPVGALSAAVGAFLARDRVEVQRLTKDGRRTLDARGAVVSARCVGVPSQGDTADCAILDVVVRQVTPAVRPDDVLAALRAVADLEPLTAPRASRMAQGRLDDTGGIADPLGLDRAAALAAREGVPGPAGETAVG
jgi:radical SAM-linked protein